MVDRVHTNTANRRTPTTPAIGTSFADDAQAMLAVTNFANGRATIYVHFANFAGAQTKLRVQAFASQQLYRGTC